MSRRMGPLPPGKRKIVWDSGAYVSNTTGVAIRGAYTIFGPYRIPNIELISRLVYTNKEISGSYRGYGTTQVTWACESQMDIIARETWNRPLGNQIEEWVRGRRPLHQWPGPARGWIEGDP